MRDEDLRSGSTVCPPGATWQDSGDSEMSSRCAGCSLRRARVGAAQTLLFCSHQALIGVHQCSSVVSKFFSAQNSANLGIVWRAYTPSEVICGLCILVFRTLIHKRTK
jgi:hypothetical protein